MSSAADKPKADKHDDHPDRVLSGEAAIVAERRTALAGLRRQGWAFPNDFRRNALAAELLRDYGEDGTEQLEARGLRVCLAGRMVARRVMGKAAFLHLQDSSGRLQIYLRREELPTDAYEQFKQWDLGDILGVGGTLFRTRSGELSVRANELRLLSKALRPLPEKYHGLADREARYRRRYLDLICNDDRRRGFHARARIIDLLRGFLRSRGFVEVETPMMQPLAGGATARPFVTHHNSLDLDLYLRIAPELYLKRLLIGGMEQVFEINRSFRNEGLSTRHNPEFTMLELYQAYADYRDLMTLSEELLRLLLLELQGNTMLSLGGRDYDLAQPLRRLTLREAILHYNPDLRIEQLDDAEALAAVLTRKGIAATGGVGAMEYALFEKTVEAELHQPTFITSFPLEVSPLARRSADDAERVDRFELFIGGLEVANGFSELNDPEDQAARFRAQGERRQAGDAEAMHYDADFITAMEHGMPPAAGEGIGIDRLVMLLTGAPAIRDVILFPLLRPNVEPSA